MLRKLKYLVIAMCKNLNNVTEPLKGQVNWPPETSIFTRFLKKYFLTNFDIVVHSAYLVDALCGTPKYFDGASSLVIDLNNSHWHYKLFSFQIALIYITSPRASKLAARGGQICKFLKFFILGWILTQSYPQLLTWNRSQWFSLTLQIIVNPNCSYIQNLPKGK